MSKCKDNARTAFEKGYWVDGDGVVQGPRGPRKCGVGKNGMLRFTVNRHQSPIPVMVHQLAALTLFGERGLDDDVVILHLDRDRANNRQENIAIGSRSDAMMKIPKFERVLHATNAAMHLRSLTMTEVATLRAMRANGATLKTICAFFGIAKSTASYIVNRKTYG